MSPLRFLVVARRLSSPRRIWGRQQAVGSATFLHQSRDLADDGVGGFRFSHGFPMGGDSHAGVMTVGAALSVLAAGGLIFSLKKDEEEEKNPVDVRLTDEERDMKVTVLVTDDEEAMRRRFKEWMVEYKRSYKNKKEEAWRYELFKTHALRTDEMNAMTKSRGGSARFAPSVFGDCTEAEGPCCHGTYDPVPDQSLDFRI